MGNAIQDGADCIMLSGETAKGKYPLEAVQTMSEVAQEVEGLTSGESIWRNMRDATLSPVGPIEAMASSAVALSFVEDFAMLVIISESGETARYTAKYHPDIPILIVTDKPHIYRQAAFQRGVHPLLVDSLGNCADALVEQACVEGKSRGMANVGDKIIAIYDSNVSDGLEEATILRVITVQ